jgi:nitrogen fixation protein NifT
MTMPKVMLRKTAAGSLSFYVAKKDLEADVSSVEFDTPEKWGGRITLSDGSCFFVEPFNERPQLPLTVRATRLGE